VVLGPTGAAKSDLSLILAEKLHGEIINCDSIQVYRELHIGSAKVPVEARRGIPHHLTGILSIEEELTAGAYARMARAVLSLLRSKGKLPVVVGGTGFYLRALLHGLSPAPMRNPDLRARLSGIAARRPHALHRFLRHRDPIGASRIHPNDHQKLIRAIELTIAGGAPASTIQNRPRDSVKDFQVLKIGLAPDRKLLYERLNHRAAWMFEHGLIDETKAILQVGYSPAAKPLRSLGYKQALKVIANQLTREEALRECQTRTRQYAKRQMTWFRAEHDVHWLAGFGDEPRIQQQALNIAGAFVSS